MAFTKIAAAGIGSTGTVTLENLVVTGSINADSLTGAASTANVRTNTLNVSGVSTLGSTVVNGSVRITGVSTIGNTVVGGATTELVVNGNARITGILTVGTASITFNGNDNSVTIGTGVTVFGNVGIISATEFRGNGANLTGVQPFPSGTLMLFQQTAAPTGWTKQTTHNDKTLRVVSGSASSGGSTAFTSVFTSRTPSGSVSVSGSNSGGGVSNTTLTTTTMPSHSHTIARSTNLNNSNDTCLSTQGVSGSVTTSAVGSSGAHGHGYTNATWSGSGSFTGSSMDFAVQYVDLIIASKD